MCQFKVGDLVVQKPDSRGYVSYPEYDSTVFIVREVFALDYEDEDDLGERELYDWVLDVESLEGTSPKIAFLAELMQPFKPSVFEDKKYENLYE